MNLFLLNNKKRVILSIFIDFIIINLFLNRFALGDFVSALNFTLLWVIVSYVLGRYHSPNLQKNKYILLIFLKTIFTSVLVGFSFTILNYILDLNKLYFVLNNLKLSNYFLFIILSFSVRLIFDYLYLNCFKRNKKWLIVGSPNFKNDLKIRSLENSTSGQFTFEYIDKINDEIQINSKEYYGIIINKEKIENSLKSYNLISNLKNKGIKIFNEIEWYEIFLNRIPTSLLNKEKSFYLYLKFKKTSIQFRIKRLGDLFLSIIILILSIPIIIISGILIFLEDRGPIFYSQVRTGYGGSKFKIIKLRTMMVNAESNGAKWSQRSDSRITKVGEILRKIRFDELPQLISVIKGEMSLIGPRPERPEIEANLLDSIPHYYLRYEQLPGLSGWAQVNYPYGASKEDTENKLSYDIYYIRNFSIFLDFLILFKTIRLVFNGKGALAKS